MNKTAVIVSGGMIFDEFTLEKIQESKPTYLIGVDRGVSFFYRNQLMPNYIVGDFDSLPPEIVEHYKKEKSIQIREFQPEKDASDTEIAVRLGVELGCEKVIILGATGGRLDHLWANVQVLNIALENGVEAWIMDPQNKIRLINRPITLNKKKSFGTYFSLFPLGGEVKELSIRGAKYPLEGYCLTPENSRCVSNEFKEDEVHIAFGQGKIILMETKDRNEV